MALGARLQSFLRYGKYSSRQRVGNPIAEFYPLEVDIDVVYQNFQTVPIGCSQCRRIGGIDSIGRHKAHGIYSAYQSLPIYAEVFERLGHLDRLEDFAGSFGADFYGLPRNRQTIVLTKRRIYKTPWQGDPRVNIQNHKGKAKAYQVKQVLKAIDKLEVEHGIKE